MSWPEWCIVNIIKKEEIPPQHIKNILLLNSVKKLLRPLKNEHRSQIGPSGWFHFHLTVNLKVWTKLLGYGCERLKSGKAPGESQLAREIYNEECCLFSLVNCVPTSFISLSFRISMYRVGPSYPRAPDSISVWLITNIWGKKFQK